jgi:transposase InsO family protein
MRPAGRRHIEAQPSRPVRRPPRRPSHRFTQNDIWAERFNQTLLREWAYVRLYRTNDERLDALPAWLAYYNDERTHAALGGIAPAAALVNNLRGNHT